MGQVKCDKYTKGEDGQTAWERRRGGPCDKPLAKIGERLLYLYLETASVHGIKAEPKMEEGIWFGTNARTQELLSGTGRGVVKCRIIKRLPKEEMQC